MLVYRNSKDFHMLIFYPTTSLNLLIKSNKVFLGGCFRIRKFCHSQIVNFTSFVPILMPFLSFSCLISLARNSNTLLSRNDESWQPCLVPSLRGKTFNFSPLSMMLTVILSYVAYIMLRFGSSVLNFWRGFY